MLNSIPYAAVWLQVVGARWLRSSPHEHTAVETHLGKGGVSEDVQNQNELGH